MKNSKNGNNFNIFDFNNKKNFMKYNIFKLSDFQMFFYSIDNLLVFLLDFQRLFEKTRRTFKFKIGEYFHNNNKI